MSCFGGGVVTTYSSSPLSGGMMRGGGRSRRPWWWRAKCAGIAASVGSKLRRSIRKGIDGRRRRRSATSSVTHTHHHHRRQYSSFAPVYVDDLYTHDHHQQQQQPGSSSKALKLNAAVDVTAQEEPSTSGKLKLDAADATPRASRATSGKATARVRAVATGCDASTGGKPPRAAGVGGAMRNILMRSPGRGGGGVLGVVKGMGEVDLRAELFIRKFKEDMRLQSQRSAEELQAMLARGL